VPGPEGSKGGVGKSMMTLATVDHLLEQGESVLLVECDTSNPDVCFSGPFLLIQLSSFG
jgi:CO dehydrogenase nickel-insertion accessory protein CooC1